MGTNLDWICNPMPGLTSLDDHDDAAQGCALVRLPGASPLVRLGRSTPQVSRLARRGGVQALPDEIILVPVGQVEAVVLQGGVVPVEVAGGAAVSCVFGRR